VCEIFLLQNVQTSSEAHSASYTMMPAFFLLRVNRSGCAASPSPSHSFPFPRLHVMERENFTICLLHIYKMKNFHPNDWITNCFQQASLHYRTKCKIVTETLISYRELDWRNTSHCALCGPQTVTLKCGHGNSCFKTRGTCGPPILDGLQRKRNHETSYCQRNLLFH